ncbi:MAG: ATPase, T2SS/T4P/T4SS family [Candidatus Omnitrophica bacterium]|nr:ATPase, T2SS/T4P/T4SS family [Candidatus Omnitrophota bacterium]
MIKSKYLKLGEILISQGLITQDQLDQAMLIQKREGGRIGEVLIKTGIVKEDSMVAALAKQLNMPYITFASGSLKPKDGQGLETLISKDFALRNTVLPLSKDADSLTCAVFDPLDLMLIDNLRKITGCEINTVVASKTDISKAIEEFYGRADLLKEAVQKSYGVMTDFTAEAVGDEESLSMDKIIAKAEEAPVVKLVDLIIRQAIDERASDIHIEPFRDKVSLRYRVDGKLYEIPPPAKQMHLPIISRIKILAKLDIAEKRLPQDGTFMVRLEDRNIDLRISTIPTIYGEKVVLRILDRSRIVLDLNKMGFDQNQLQFMRKAINSPYGLVFLTGPTGSGKSTTLYAVLQEIKAPTKNIMTVEDPVEYRLDGVNQIQVKPEIGLTFASALRSFLRQDPDIMLVGEVRDLETAEICVRSALTGHLVLSTLHTNDAPSAIGRLMDIGIEPYLLTPSLLVVIAQRLIRTLCPGCKEAYEPSEKELGGIKLNSGLIYKAKGCSECGQMGYKGRTLIAEVMPITDAIKELVSQGATFQKIREVARSEGMQTLYESGLRKVEQGITSLEEVLSVTLGI